MILITAFLLSINVTAGDAKTLKIGYLLCLSDWFSVFDSTEELNLKTVVQVINERGGLTIKGERYDIELVGEVGKSTLDGINGGAIKLVYDHQVKFFVGSKSFFTTASTPVFERNQVLHVSGYNTCQPGEMDQSIPYLMPKIKKLLEMNGFIMSSDTVGFLNQMEDFSPIATKINAIKDADAIFVLNGCPVAVGLISKALRELGNDIVSVGPTPHARGNPPILDEVYDRSIKVRDIPSFYLLVPEGLWTLAQVIQAANSLDPTDVKKQWESMETVDSLYGPDTLGDQETYGLKNYAIGHPMSYSKLVNDKVVYGGWVDVVRILYVY